MPGLEKKRDRLILRGIGLLERTTGGYRLSDAGSELGAAYRRHPEGSEWVRVLARLLLTREPRTRVLAGLLSEPEAELYFTSDEWWGGSRRLATINFADGRQLAPFAKKNEALPNLRSAIDERAWWAFGEWRDHELVDGVDDCRFVGCMKEDYSLHDISLALRAACEVFLHLGVLVHQAGRCWWDHDAAIREFGTSLAKDFGWQPTKSAETLLEIVAQLIAGLQTDTGFIVASELRNRLRKQGVDNPDREIARLEAEGRLVIEATDYGQSRHGIGLYDDPSKQLIRLRVY